jgi:ABC-type Fe3+-siderophore transport system permease subunit
VLFRVTVTVPAADAVNVRIAEPRGAIIALSACVPGAATGVVGVVGVVELSPPHAAQKSTSPSASRAGQVRRLIKNPLL